MADVTFTILHQEGIPILILMEREQFLPSSVFSHSVFQALVIGGLICSVSFGDTVDVVCGVAWGVTPGVRGTRVDVREKSATSP